MSTKACTEETRTQGLYYFYPCSIFSELVGPPVASAAADISHFTIASLPHQLCLVIVDLSAAFDYAKGSYSPIPGDHWLK
ncbi:hypothetical protein QSH57_010450 [Fusarium oxysporum f. sp. vasinfectum]|nr:hypothetical protein QSH57_010450 [Fusarium oxysporum f. sp. vasinfectum]